MTRRKSPPPPRARSTAAYALAIAAAVLAADAHEPSRVVAARIGISPQRVRAIRLAAGQRRARGGPRGPATIHSVAGRELLAELVADARAAQVDPAEYLTDARHQRGVTDRIVAVLADAHDRGVMSERERLVWCEAIGPVDPGTVGRLRATLWGTGEA